MYCIPCSIYQYLQDTFIPTLQAIRWYGDWYQIEPGLMADFSTKFLGVAALRQHRVVKDLCPIPKEVWNLSLICTKEYSSEAAAYGEFDEFWMRKTVEVEYNRVNEFWKYKNEGKSITGEYYLLDI